MAISRDQPQEDEEEVGADVADSESGGVRREYLQNIFQRGCQIHPPSHIRDVGSDPPPIWGLGCLNNWVNRQIKEIIPRGRTTAYGFNHP